MGDYPDIEDALNEAWAGFCRENFEVDGELSVLQILDFTGAPEGAGKRVDLDVLIRATHNISSWHQSAVNRFLPMIKSLGAPIASPSTHAKHFPNPSHKTSEQVSDSSLNGVSKFGLRISVNVLNDIFRDVEAEFLDRIFGKSKFRGFVDCINSIGYTSGEETQFLAIEWTPSFVHAYPIPKVTYMGSLEARRSNYGNSMNVTSDVAQGYMVEKL